MARTTPSFTQTLANIAVNAATEHLSAKAALEEAEERARQAREAYERSPQYHEERMRTTLQSQPSNDPMAAAALEAYTESPSDIQARAMGAASTEAGFGAQLERNSSYFSRLQRRSRDLTPTQNPSFL